MRTLFALFITCICGLAQLPPQDESYKLPQFEDTFAVDYSYAIAPGATELVTNGGFDSTTAGWTINSSSCTLASVAGGQSGNCLEVTVVSGAVQSCYGSFTTTIGEHYRISCYSKSGTSGNEALSVFILDTSFTAIGSISGTSSASWINYTVDFVATTTTSRVQLKKNTATAGTMLFDTVSCKLLSGVNNTLSTGRGKAQTRTVDGAGNVTVSNGRLNISGNGSAWTVVRYPSISRLSGTTLLYNITLQGAELLMVSGGNEIYDANSLFCDGNTTRLINTAFGAGTHDLGFSVRSAGSHLFWKINGTWNLMFPLYTTTTAITPSIQSYKATSTNTLNSIRIPRTLWSPAPVLSDNFTGANGTAVGRISNGQGHPEANGGAGLVWQAAEGWSIESNHLTNNPASTNMYDLVCVATSPTADVFLEGKFTASTLDSGFVMNLDSRENPQNFVLIYMSGVKVMIVRVVAGSPTVVFNSPTGFTYSAGAKLMAVHDRTANEYRVFYNNALITSVTLDANYANIKNNTLFGFYSGTGQQDDDCVAWARGTGGEYSILDALK